MALREVDGVWLARLQRREAAAFNELVREYQTSVFRLVIRLVGDRGEAEDLTQEVFVSVFKHLDTFRGESKFTTWIYRIAVNHAKNRAKYLSRRAKGRSDSYEDKAEQGDLGAHASMVTYAQMPRPDEVAGGSELERIMNAALAAVESEQRELILLRDFEGLTYDEIGEVTGLAEGTVKSKLHRARAAWMARIKEMQGKGVG